MEASGLKNDVLSLISCIECYGNNTAVVEESLKAVAALCASNYEAKDIVRSFNGIKFLWKYVASDSFSTIELTLSALTCVIDRNVYNQRLVTSKEVFERIKEILTSSEIFSSLFRATLLFTSAILFRNLGAQTLIRETRCLELLVNFYKQLLPSGTNDVNSTDQATHLWQIVNTILCCSINNPRNEENQLICSDLFPLVLEVLQSCRQCTVISTLSLFLSLCISSNSQNQCAFVMYSGLTVLKFCLSKGIEAVHKATDDSEYFKRVSDAIMGVISVVDAVISNNEQNAESFGKSGAISLLLELLNVKEFDDNSKMKILVTISHCLDTCRKNKTALNMGTSSKLRQQLQCCISSSNNDLKKASLYLLHICKKKNDNAILPERGSHIDEQDKENSFISFSSSRSASCITEVEEHMKILNNHKASNPATALSNSAENRIFEKTDIDAVNRKCNLYLASLKNSSERSYRTKAAQNGKDFYPESVASFNTSKFKCVFISDNKSNYSKISAQYDNLKKQKNMLHSTEVLSENMFKQQKNNCVKQTDSEFKYPGSFYKYKSNRFDKSNSHKSMCSSNYSNTFIKPPRRDQALENTNAGSRSSRHSRTPLKSIGNISYCSNYSEKHLHNSLNSLKLKVQNDSQEIDGLSKVDANILKKSKTFCCRNCLQSRFKRQKMHNVANKINCLKKEAPLDYISYISHSPWVDVEQIVPGERSPRSELISQFQCANKNKDFSKLDEHAQVPDDSVEVVILSGEKCLKHGLFCDSEILKVLPQEYFPKNSKDL